MYRTYVRHMVYRTYKAKTPCVSYKNWIMMGLALWPLRESCSIMHWDQFE